MLYELVPTLLPANSSKRTGFMYPKWITIHETSVGTNVREKEYNFSHYYHLLLQNDNTIGYHYLVEANYGKMPKVYQFIEDNRTTSHTGNHVGNYHSIGIERLVNCDTDFSKAIEVQAALTAKLMYEYQIPLHAVVPHKYWSGKECPARLLAGQNGGWEHFIQIVEAYYQEISQSHA